MSARTTCVASKLYSLESYVYMQKKIKKLQVNMKYRRPD
jgi:hypothetical protein